MKKSVKFVMEIKIAMTVVVILLAIMGVAGTLTVGNVAEKKASIYQQYTDGYNSVIDAYSNFAQAKANAEIVVLTQDVAEQKEHFSIVTQNFSSMEEHLQKAETEFTDADILELLAKIKVNLVEAETSLGEVMEQIQNDSDEEVDFTYAESVQDSTEVLMQNLKSMVQEKKTEATEHSERYQLVSQLFLQMLMLGGIIFAFVIEFYMVRQIKAPLSVLSKASKKLAVGDVDVDLKKYKQNEFGNLTDDFQSVVNNIHEQAEVASRVAVGDLTVDVKVNGASDLLGNALSTLVEGNNSMMANITEASMQVMTGADQVASASQSLAQGSTQQASAIEQVTASITDIAERTRINANQANEANNLVQNTKESAMHGNVQMKEMIGAMEAINDSSENISRIIKVIDDIAFQTNILALNAAVEAARAGAHGKGFAVVAEEVRNLAGKSAAAASETAEMIEDSIRKVERGSQLATETAEALNTIVEEVDHIVTIINSITVAFNDQATAVAQIDQAISQVSTVVQTNSATSQQCAAASEELSNQAAKLKELVSRYRLKNNYHHGASANFGYQNTAGTISAYHRNAPVGTASSAGSFSIGMNAGASSVMPDIPTAGTTSYQPNAENEKIIALGDGFGKY